MTMGKRFAIVLTTLGVLLGGGAVAAAPAHAAYDGCDFGYVCIYTATGGTGTHYAIHVVSGFCTNITVGDNTADSFYNHRDNRHVQFYQLPDCQGYVLCRDGALINCPGSLDDPFPAGAFGNFIDQRGVGTNRKNHRNRASSIFGNTG